MKGTTIHDGLSIIMHELMSRYKERVPDVVAILEAMKAKGVIERDDEIQNDHIAFRTMGVPFLGIQSLERIFVHYGYTKRDYYEFKGKKLNAYWFAPPDEKFPRIFISELKVDELSESVQKIIYSYTNEVKSDPLDKIDLDDPNEVAAFLHTSLWRLPDLHDYKALLSESEYAAWVIYNRYYLNHYTISIHYLQKGYNTIQEFNEFLESMGIQLNDAGGKIKVSDDGLLLQSSTVAQTLTAHFAHDETFEIAGSYVEFAERRPLPEFSTIAKNNLKREHLRDGFETANADKIFESTFTSQIKKSK